MLYGMRWLSQTKPIPRSPENDKNQDISDFQNLSVFSNFWHEITLYAIDIDKKRFRRPFLALQNHFENRPSTRLYFPQHLRMSHIELLWQLKIQTIDKTLRKTKQTRRLSSSCQSNFLRSYHKFKQKSSSHFIFRISTISIN